MSLKTFFKKNKGVFLGLFVGMLIMVPFMYQSSYERLDVEYFETTDDLTYIAFYEGYFGESVSIPSNDTALICIMNVTKARYILVSIEFEGDIDIIRVGVLKHDTSTLMFDIENPTIGFAKQISIEESGIYSCGIFFTPKGQYSINMAVIYLS